MGCQQYKSSGYKFRIVKVQNNLEITEDDILNAKQESNSQHQEVLINRQDGRTQINKIQEGTYQDALCKIIAKIQDRTLGGSGSCITNQNGCVLLMTCAHLFIKYEIDIINQKIIKFEKDSLKSFYGMNGKFNYKQQQQIDYYFIDRKYNQKNNGIFSGYDIAIGFVDQNYFSKIEAIKNIKLGSIENLKVQAGEEIVIIGYPGEKDTDYLYEMKGQILEIITIKKNPSRKLLLYRIDTTHGQSGSPVYLIRNGVHYLIGVHVGCTSPQNNCNVATAITNEVLSFINSINSNTLKKHNKNQFNKEKNLNNQLKYQEVAQTDQKDVQVDPNSDLYQNSLGDELLNQKKFEEAKLAYDKAIQINPNVGLYYNNKGNSLYFLNKYEEAINYYNKAIEINPNDALFYYNKGMVLYELQEYNKAIQEYDKALSIKQNYAYALNNKGFALFKLTKYQEATNEYDKAIKLNPSNDAFHNNKGNALSLLKKYQEAVKSYDKAIEANPTDALYYFNKGNALFDLKYYEKAVQEYDQALKISPNYEEAQFNLKTALYLLQFEEKKIQQQDIDLINNQNDILYNNNIIRNLQQSGIRNQQ